jgi:hypothetical protein
MVGLVGCFIRNILFEQQRVIGLNFLLQILSNAIQHTLGFTGDQFVGDNIFTDAIIEVG